MELNDDDLNQLNIRIGPKKKLQAIILKLKSTAYDDSKPNDSESSESDSPAPALVGTSKPLVEKENDENSPEQNQPSPSTSSITSKWSKVNTK